MGKIAELVLTSLHVALWAQLGVLTRLYLDKLFTDGCQGYWGLCLLSEGAARSPAGGTRCTLLYANSACRRHHHNVLGGLFPRPCVQYAGQLCHGPGSLCRHAGDQGQQQGCGCAALPAPMAGQRCAARGSQDRLLWVADDFCQLAAVDDAAPGRRQGRSAGRA